jgi:hypothetical protein
MNRQLPSIARAARDRGHGANPVLKVALIYQNFAAGVHARDFFEKLVRSPELGAAGGNEVSDQSCQDRNMECAKTKGNFYGFRTGALQGHPTISFF